MTGPNDDDGVGYRRPPTATRFAKGRSGNPRGRPKGSKGHLGLGKMLQRKVSITVDGKRQSVELTEAVALQMSRQALAGNVAAARELFRIAQQQKDLEAAIEASRPEPVTELRLVMVDPKSCNPALEALGVITNVGGRFKIEPWVVEAARARGAKLDSPDEALISNSVRRRGEYEEDPGIPVDGWSSRKAR